MALLGSLQVRLGLDASTFSQGFNAFQKGMEKRATAFQRSMRGLTNMGSLIGGVGVGAGLTKAITDAGNFQQSLSQVQAAAGATSGEIKALSDLALELGRTTVFGANAAAEAMLDLAKAGLDPAQIAGGALTSTMQLAATEGMELSRAAEVLAEQMGAFGLSAEDTAAIADALAGASIASTASVDGLAQGLSQVAAVANLSGLNIQETSGALALLAQNGIKGSDAGTSLKTMLLRLTPSTKEAEMEMKRLGISFADSNGQIKDITEISQILQDKLGGLSDAQRNSTLQTLFGTDAFRAAAIFTKAGSKELQTYIDATTDKTAAERLSEARTKGLNGSLTILRNSIENLGITLLQGGFLDGLATLATKASELLGRASEMPNWMKNTAVGLTIAAAAAPPLAFGLTTIAGAIPVLTSVIGGLATFLLGPWGIALAAGVGTFIAFKDEILQGITSIKQWFTDWIAANQTNIQALGTAWQTLKASASNLFSSVVTVLSSVADSFHSAFGVSTADLLKGFGIAAAASMTGMLDGATSMLSGLSTAADWFAANLPIMVQGIADFGKSAIDFLTPLGTWISATFTPLFEAWKNGVVSVLNVVRSAFQLWWEAISLVFGYLAEKFGQFVGWIAQTDTFKIAVVGLTATFVKFGNDVKTVVEFVAKKLTSLYEIGSGAINKLAGAFDSAREKLRLFGDAGEKETDRAVGNSWLTDLCEIGKNKFQELISGGINPASDAIEEFGKVGNSLNTFSGGFAAAAFAPRAIPVDEETLQPISIQAAQDFESAWAISLRNTSAALDEFVFTGEMSVKGLVRTMIAEFASAQLRKAIQSLWEGVGKIFTGGGTTSGGGSIWGSLGNLAGSVFKAFGSFEGGGYTGSGPRTGGMDGRGGRLALLHPQETVIDHTKIRATSAKAKTPQVNLSVPITLMPGVSRQELSQILPQLQREIIQTIPELIQRGGTYAAAFGQ